MEWSLQFSLDPNLVAVVMQIESCGHPEIQSPAGALGLFQVMPFHFSEDEQGLDPGTNAKRGLSYLSRALEISEGDQATALAGYNGGHSVINWDKGYWPAETSRYVYWSTGILEDIRAGLTDSPRLQEWLSNGGASLCSLAAEALDL
jgi:soluble lytic murein transglycosylase-like protein